MSLPSVFLIAAAFGQVAADTTAGPATSPDDPAARKAQLKQFVEVAESYRITLHSAKPELLELSPTPILNWTGSAFVWQKDGHPEAIGSFWTDFYPRSERVRWHHAFHSLSDQPLTAEFDSKMIWMPRRPGIAFQPVAGAEPPADKPRQRLAQMRTLSREFSVVQTRDSGKTRLRLLTQPVLRYEPTAGVAKDGAIFAFAHPTSGTDPDALLLIEARESEGGVRWEFALARFHFVETAAFLGEKEVWKVESESLEMRRTVFGGGQGRDKIYYSVAPP